MTPSQIIDQMRSRYNAEGDSFWDEAELLNIIYQGCMELATETLCIERVFTTTTADGTREYAFPSNVISIKTVTYDDEVLDPMSPEEDLLYDSDFSTATEGNVSRYAFYNETLYLRPTPDAAKTLKILAAVEPQSITATSTLELPSRYHLALIDFGLANMLEKDKDYGGASYYRNIWAGHIRNAARFEKKRKRGQRPAHVRLRMIQGRFA